MKGNYIVSTNIERDTERELNYILTPNAKDIFDRIISNYLIGNHTFNIIGSYGTGKSSFLWALEKNLKDGQPIFAPLNGQFSGLNNFKFLKFIGESNSFKNQFAYKIGIPEFKNDKDLFSTFDKFYRKQENQGKVLVLIIDEFGKYLEYAAKHNPDEELYFIQQLAEYINHPDRHILLITTLHQNFGTYAKGLTTEQRFEWEKVKGRIKDLAFDEPVEQLLFFAAEKLAEIKLPKSLRTVFESQYHLIDKTKLLPKLKIDIAEKLYPLDYLAAYILTSALQRYGQNERSLFSFLFSTDENGIMNFENKIFDVPEVFNYLSLNLSSEIADPGNPHKAQWNAIKVALERSEVMLEDDYHELTPIIKTIGLVNIFGKAGGQLSKEVLAKYISLSKGIKQSEDLIDKLLQKKIVKFFSFRNKINFLDGTDADLDKELLNAGKNINSMFSISEVVKRYVSFPYIPAKAYQYKYGTPRFFAYTVTDGLVTKPPREELDGFINLIFSPARIKSKILKKSKEDNQAQIYVLYEDIEQIRNQLFEILKYEYVIDKLKDDRVAIKILKEDHLRHVNRLNDLIIERLFDSDSSIVWIYKKQRNDIDSKGALNILLTEVCEDVYGNDLIVKNELINREILSTPIRTARKALLKHLLEFSDDPNLGFEDKKFPPEKTIYLSLIKNNGMHRNHKDYGWGLYKPQSEDIKLLWLIGERFIDSSKSVKQSLHSFIEMLTEGQEKIKSGLAEFWMYIFLIAKKEEFALFHIESGYVPYLSTDVLDLIYKKPSNYQLKSYNVSGVKLNLFNSYQELTNLSDQSRSTKETFISIFRQFSLFYRGLPKYCLNTKNISASAQGLRYAIGNAKDPETALFEEFPAALNFHGLKLESADISNIKDYVNQLNSTVAELRGAMDELYDKIENTLLDAVGIHEQEFRSYQLAIQKRFKLLNTDLLTQKQRKFYMRLNAPLENRNIWLKSISDEILGKKVETIQDEEESLLMANLRSMIYNLERLIPIHKLKAEKNDEEIVRIDIIDEEGKSNDSLISIKSKDLKAVQQIEKDLTLLLKEKDNQLSLAALYKVLKKKMS